MKNLQIVRKIFVLSILPIFILACSMFGGNSPTASYKAFAGAARKKDAATMKQYLSDSFLKTVKEAAKYSNKSEDEFLSTFSDNIGEADDISNEKISTGGTTATLEIKTKSNDVQVIKFVKDGIWKIDSSGKKTDSVAETTTTASPDSTKSDTSTPADSSPVTISASELIDEARSSGSEMGKKYSGRMMTVTGAELWEVQYSMLHIGAKYGSYSSGYIICNGSFSDYMPYSSKVSDMRKAGKSPGATIKGEFSKVVVDSGYTQVHLSPCVLSNLEK